VYFQARMSLRIFTNTYICIHSHECTFMTSIFVHTKARIHTFSLGVMSLHGHRAGNSTETAEQKVATRATSRSFLCFRYLPGITFCEGMCVCVCESVCVCVCFDVSERFCVGFTCMCVCVCVALLSARECAFVCVCV
jgi:hypothetical protein